MQKRYYEFLTVFGNKENVAIYPSHKTVHDALASYSSSTLRPISVEPVLHFDLRL